MNKLILAAGIIAFALGTHQAQADPPISTTSCQKKCTDEGIKNLYFAYKVKITNGVPKADGKLRGVRLGK
jgi:hypothetical protein